MPRLTPEQAAKLKARLTPEQLEEQRYKRLMYSDFHAFLTEAWPYVDPADYVPNWHAELICKNMEKVASHDITRLMVNVPPGTSKSTIMCVMFPAWLWLTQPHKAYMFVSYGLDISRRDATKTRILVESEWYNNLIPKRYGPNKNEKWTLDGRGIDMFHTSERGFRMATSVGGAIMGFRADYIVVDDGQQADEYVTPETQEKTWSFFTKALSTRVKDERSSCFVVIQQRVAEGDLAGRILERDNEHARLKTPNWQPYVKVILPAEYEPRFHSDGDPRTVPGELLFPERMPKYVLDFKRQSMGEAAYAAQYRQDPVAAGAGIFNLDRVSFWYDPELGIPEPHREVNKDGVLLKCAQVALPLEEDINWNNECMSWDTSFKGTAGADFVAGQLWKLWKNKCFLIDQVHKRMGFSETKAEILAFGRKYPTCLAKYVEEAANGAAILDALKDEVHGLIPIKPEGGKLSRANAVAPLFDAGQIVLPHPVQFPWVLDLLAELRGFPRARHDDQVDALTQALPRLIEGDLSWFENLGKM